MCETDLMHEWGTDALLITYGRLSADAVAAVERLRAAGISCGFLRLVQIYPIPSAAIEICLQYQKIVFFEEGSTEGGICEKLAAQLLLRGYKGAYQYHGTHGFVPPASVQRCLTLQGLDADAMYDSVKAVCEDGTA